MGYAEKAVAATNRKDHAILDTLAAAYAEAGQFTNAISTQKEAIGLVQDANVRAAVPAQAGGHGHEAQRR